MLANMAYYQWPSTLTHLWFAVHWVVMWVKIYDLCAACHSKNRLVVLTAECSYPGCKVYFNCTNCISLMTSFLVVSSSFPHSGTKIREGNNKKTASQFVLYNYTKSNQGNHSMNQSVLQCAYSILSTSACSEWCISWVTCAILFMHKHHE